MKDRPSPDSPRKPLKSTPVRATRRRLGVASALGLAAVSAAVLGLGTPASSAPRSSEAQPAVVAVVSEQQVEPEAGKPLVAPDPAVQQRAVQQPAEPVTPETPGAAIADVKRATTAFEAAAGKASAPGARPDPDTLPAMPNFADVAVGAALGELEARFNEFAHNQWVQTGSAVVIGTERVEVVRVGEVPTHRFWVCVDSSSIEIRDTAGAVVLAAAPAGTRTAMNTYDIQQQKGTWVVVGHSFPDAAAC